MLATKAYAAQSATSPVAPHTIQRREPGPHDVLFDVLYCGICHTDIHQTRGHFDGSADARYATNDFMARHHGINAVAKMPASLVNIGMTNPAIQYVEQHIMRSWLATLDGMWRDGRGRGLCGIGFGS